MVRRFGPVRVVLFLALAASGPLSAQRARVGEPAPDFALPALTGDTVHLAGLRGHPVILNFWASWCPPCRVELPDLVTAYGAHRGDGLRIIAVNGDDERPSLIREFTGRMGLPFPILLDRKARVTDRYRVVGLPTTVFIDTGGIVRALHPGPITTAQITAGLLSILEPDAPRPPNAPRTAP